MATIPIKVHIEASIKEAYRPQPGEVLIAITEPGQTPITPLGTFAATYHLAAWDLPRTIDHPKYGRIGPLTLNDAAPLLEFVLKHRNTMSKLVIYCKAGVARSPAVAIALSEWLPTSPHTYQLIKTPPVSIARRIAPCVTPRSREDSSWPNDREIVARAF